MDQDFNDLILIAACSPCSTDILLPQLAFYFHCFRANTVKLTLYSKPCMWNKAQLNMTYSTALQLPDDTQLYVAYIDSAARHHSRQVLESACFTPSFPSSPVRPTISPIPLFLYIFLYLVCFLPSLYITLIIFFSPIWHMRGHEKDVITSPLRICFYNLNIACW